MNENIITTIITCVCTLIGVFISARATQDKVTHELDKQNALQNAEIQHIKDEIREMKVDIKSHNHYSQMFQETCAVLQEKQAVANKRILDLEKKVM